MKQNSAKKKTGKFLGAAAILFGLALFLYPDVKTFYLDQHTADLISEFNECQDPETAESAKQDADPFHRSTEMIPGTKEMLCRIKDYNDQIFADGQSDFRDAWSAAQIPVAVDELADGMFGYIEIPDMNVTLPLYAGATTEHLSEGAAILGGTSIPVGGINTNSVIAGHRGYRGAPYFRDIEELSVGDDIYITNPWETLSYRVESVDIIAPDGSNAVRIQEGKDMVTLLTCHPYRSGGKYRYVVYCVRDNSRKQDGQDGKDGQDHITASEGKRYETSRNDIRIENIIRKCGALVLLLIICITFLKSRRNRNKKRRRK